MAEIKATIVEFHKDVYPYVKGDVVALTTEELEAIDARAKRYEIEKAYTNKGKTVKKDEADVKLEEQVEETEAPEEGNAVPKDSEDTSEDGGHDEATEDKTEDKKGKK